MWGAHEYEYVMSHINMSHVTHMDRSCHTRVMRGVFVVHTHIHTHTPTHTHVHTHTKTDRDTDIDTETPG